MEKEKYVDNVYSILKEIVLENYSEIQNSKENFIFS